MAYQQNQPPYQPYGPNQRHQPYQQFPPPAPQPPQRRPSRRGTLIAGVAVAAVLVVAVGVSAGVWLAGRTDRNAAGTRDERSSHANEAEPREEAPGDQPAVDDEITPITTALTSAGYACYQSLTEPVQVAAHPPTMVHTCYLDPASDANDEQDVLIQSNEQGEVTALTAFLSYSEYPASGELPDGDRSKPAGQAFDATIRALEGTVLTGDEADELISRKYEDEEPEHPGFRIKRPLEWGSAELYVADHRMYYTLEMAAQGSEWVAIPHGGTGVTVEEAEAHLSGEGFSCDIRIQLETMVCDQRKPGRIYTVSVFDECLKHEERYAELCAGRTAYTVTVSVAFQTEMSNADYEDLGRFLLGTADYALGGASSAAEAWMIESFGVSEPRTRRADFQGMHVTYAPGVLVPGGGPNSEYPNGVQIVVEGHNLTR